MTAAEIKQFIADLNTALKQILGINYTIKHRVENNTFICEVTFNYDQFDGSESEDWRLDVDDVMKSLHYNWGCQYYDEDNKIIITI